MSSLLYSTWQIFTHTHVNWTSQLMLYLSIVHGKCSLQPWQNNFTTYGKFRFLYSWQTYFMCHGIQTLCTIALSTTQCMAQFFCSLQWRMYLIIYYHDTFFHNIFCSFGSSPQNTTKIYVLTWYFVNVLVCLRYGGPTYVWMAVGNFHICHF